MSASPEEIEALAIKVGIDSMRHDPAVWHEALAHAMPKMLNAVVPTLMALAWDEGYEAAAYMARCWGHVDSWEDEPDNPYRADATTIRNGATS